MNDDKEVNVGNFQVWDVYFLTIVICMFLIQTQKKRKWLITYFKTHGIMALKKTCWCESCLIIKSFEEKVNGPKKGTQKKKPTNKRSNVSSDAISKFFIVEIFFKKNDE